MIIIEYYNIYIVMFKLSVLKKIKKKKYMYILHKKLNKYHSIKK